MELRHCCHADLHGSAAALPWKAQGFWTILSQNPAPEQSRSALQALAFQACGFVPYALYENPAKSLQSL